LLPCRSMSFLIPFMAEILPRLENLKVKDKVIPLRAGCGPEGG